MPQLARHVEHSSTQPLIRYWRDGTNEADYVLRYQGKLWAFEVATQGNVRGLHAFRAWDPQCRVQVLLQAWSVCGQMIIAATLHMMDRHSPNRIRNEQMNTQTHRQRANESWIICNLLRGRYKRNECCKAILPLTERYKTTGYPFYNLSKQELTATGCEVAA